jgi:hypothetical protein
MTKADTPGSLAELAGIEPVTSTMPSYPKDNKIND